MTSRLHIIGRRHIYPDVGGYSRGSLYFQCIFGSYRVFPVYHLVKHGIRNPDNRRKLSNSLFRFGFLFDGFAAVRAAYYAHSLMEQSLLYPVHPDAPADAGSARYRFLHPLHLCLLRQQAERDQPLHHRKLLESKGRIKHSDSSRAGMPAVRVAGRLLPPANGGSQQDTRLLPDSPQLSGCQYGK